VRAVDNETNDTEKPSTDKPTAKQIRSAARNKRHIETKRFPPSLSSVKSEYQKFCDTTGGPITIDGFSEISDFHYCCRDFPLRKFEKIISRWQRDKAKGIRHWPAMAFAADNYSFLQREFKRYGKPPSPSEVRELLMDIAKAARSLKSSLLRLQGFASQISDGSNPIAVPHLAWMDEFIAQAMAGISSTNISEDPSVLMKIHFARLGFLKRISLTEAAATVSIEKLDLPSLRHTRGGDNRSLRRLVSMAKSIWNSLTGRKPSVHKAIKQGIEIPDFVIFVQELAEIAGGPVPSPKQVASAFKPPHLPK
jgi:hypothetical protein